MIQQQLAEQIEKLRTMLQRNKRILAKSRKTISALEWRIASGEEIANSGREIRKRLQTIIL